MSILHLKLFGSTWILTTCLRTMILRKRSAYQLTPLVTAFGPFYFTFTLVEISARKTTLRKFSYLLKTIRRLIKNRLAIVFPLKHFQRFIFCSHLTPHTEHRSLLKISALTTRFRQLLNLACSDGLFFYDTSTTQLGKKSAKNANANTIT